MKIIFRGNSPNTRIKFFTLTFHHGFYKLFQKIGGQKFQIDGSPLHTNFQEKQSPTIVELSCSNPAGHPLSLPPWLWHWGVCLSLPAFPSRWGSTAISLGCQEGQQAPCRIPGFWIKSTLEKSVEISQIDAFLVRSAPCRGSSSVAVFDPPKYNPIQGLEAWRRWCSCSYDGARPSLPTGKLHFFT